MRVGGLQEIFVPSSQFQLISANFRFYEPKTVLALPPKKRTVGDFPGGPVVS